jgi:hypothetical protein
VLFPEFADTGIPVIAAAFDRFGDPRSSVVELIESDDDLIRMTWYDCIEPFVLNMPPGTDGRAIGVFSTFFPARSALRHGIALGGGARRPGLDERRAGVVGDLGRAAEIEEK